MSSTEQPRAARYVRNSSWLARKRAPFRYIQVHEFADNPLVTARGGLPTPPAPVLLTRRSRRMELQPLILINAVGLTPKLLAFCSTAIVGRWLGAIAGGSRRLSLPPRPRPPSCLASFRNSTASSAMAGCFVKRGKFVSGSSPAQRSSRRADLRDGRRFSAAAWRRPGQRSCSVVQPCGRRRDHRDAENPHYMPTAARSSASPGKFLKGFAIALSGHWPLPAPRCSGVRRQGCICTQWIARCAAEIMRSERPELTLVYLPHLDYDPQRSGPSGCDMARLAGELDQACEPILDAAGDRGLACSRREAGHVDAEAGSRESAAARRSLKVRLGPFGEMLDTFGSRAFAVCDHQVAHVYFDRRDDQVRRDAEALIGELPGVARVLTGLARREIGLDHGRAGDMVVMSQADSWFAYPAGFHDCLAPDFARTVDIHCKPRLATSASSFLTRSCSGPPAAGDVAGRGKKLGSGPWLTWCRSTQSWCEAATSRSSAPGQARVDRYGPGEAGTRSP